MKYTPLDVRHKEFANQLNGYNKREVKEFLAGVADDLEEMERQNRGMQERLLQLENQINELRQGEESLRRVVVSAERIGNEMKSNAERDASITLRDAETRSAAMLAEAESAKEHLYREALSKARDIRLDIERVRSEKSMFLSQFRALLTTYLDSVERNEDKGTG
jgi:cell division initiation protein